MLDKKKFKTYKLQYGDSDGTAIITSSEFNLWTCSWVSRTEIHLQTFKNYVKTKNTTKVFSKVYYNEKKGAKQKTLLGHDKNHPPKSSLVFKITNIIVYTCKN